MRPRIIQCGDLVLPILQQLCIAVESSLPYPVQPEPLNAQQLNSAANPDPSKSATMKIHSIDLLNSNIMTNLVTGRFTLLTGENQQSFYFEIDSNLGADASLTVYDDPNPNFSRSLLFRIEGCKVHHFLNLVQQKLDLSRLHAADFKDDTIR